MAIRLPTTPVTLPDVPDSINKVSTDLYSYLERFKLAVQQNFSGAQANCFIIATALNSGTSGTLLIASGGHIKVSSGVVISVTTN